MLYGEIMCGTNNIATDTLRDIAHCIISKGSIFRKKSAPITQPNAMY